LWSKEAKEIQEKMKESQKLKDEIVAAQKKKDNKKVERLTKKSLELQSKYMSEYMKYSMKPLLISVLLAIIILPWFNSIYGQDIIVTIPKIVPLIGGVGLTWIWWYIICSLTISLLGKKILEGSK
ncbi:MAG: EMC3/TMCO1 family protein, partial [Fervidobacterium sp.]